MEIEIPSGNINLKGDLTIPNNASAIIIFVHGSGSSRHSPRNRAVAKKLNEAGFATLLFDLLTEYEEQDRSNVFNIELLSKRLADTTKWVRANSLISKLPIGYFGASTGAAAALVASSLNGEKISAVVSRGGRVDLAGSYLQKVEVPILMIVGEEDREVLELNQEAQKEMHCINEIVVIPGATHLFEEPGAMEKVSNIAGKWFARYL